MRRGRHCQTCTTQIQAAGPAHRYKLLRGLGCRHVPGQGDQDQGMYMYGSVSCPKYSTSLVRPRDSKSFASTILSLLSHTRFRCNPAGASHGGGERLRPAARPGLGAVSESPARALPRLHRMWSKTTRPRAQEQHPSPRLPRPRAHGHDGGSESVGGSRCAVLEPPEYDTARGAVRSVLPRWI
jgi:hypothetical protein